MSKQPESALTVAERHVREGEAHVARQTALIEELERDNHPAAAAAGREVLATLQRTLELMREHLRAERILSRHRDAPGGSSP